MASKNIDWTTIEKVFGSKSRIKIIRCLYENSPSSLTKYKLTKETGLSPAELRNHLKILVDLRWVSEEPLNPRTYHLEESNPYVKTFFSFLTGLRTKT